MGCFICQSKLFLLGFLDSKTLILQFNLSTMTLDNQYNIDGQTSNISFQEIAMNKNQTLWATRILSENIHIFSMESEIVSIYPYGWYYFYNIYSIF